MLGVLCVSAPAILCLHFICGLHTSLFFCFVLKTKTTMCGWVGAWRFIRDRFLERMVKKAIQHMQLNW